MTIAGIILGGVPAVGVGTLISSGLYGVRPNDPLTLLGSAGLILGVAVAAAAVPARRAARIDPMIALGGWSKPALSFKPGWGERQE